MFDILPTMRSVQSKAAESGYFHTVELGEPKSSLQGHGMEAYIWMDSVAVAGTTLNYAIEIHTVTLRLYMPMLTGDTLEDEVEMDAAVNQVKRNLAADFDLGGTVRNVDFAGQHSGGLESVTGFVDLSGTQYRIVDITLPVIVDDIAELVA